MMVIKQNPGSVSITSRIIQLCGVLIIACGVVSLSVSYNGMQLLGLHPLDSRILSGEAALFFILAIMFSAVAIVHLNPPSLKNRPVRSTLIWISFGLCQIVSIFTGVFGISYSTAGDEYVASIENKLVKFEADITSTEQYMADLYKKRIGLHSRRALDAQEGKDPSGKRGQGAFYNAEKSAKWHLQKNYGGILDHILFIPSNDISMDTNIIWNNADQGYAGLMYKEPAFLAFIVDEKLDVDYSSLKENLDDQYTRLKTQFNSIHTTLFQRKR